jgi:hypothetical protein
LYSHLRFVIAASLIAFGSVIAVGVPALFLAVDRPLVTRADISDPPADPSCAQQSWLHLDPNCLSRRDMPWVAGRASANAGPVEDPVESDSRTAEQPLTDTQNQHAATVSPEPVPQLFAPQMSVPQTFKRQDPTQYPAPREAASQQTIPADVPPQPASPQSAPQASAPPEPARQAAVPRAAAPQEPAIQQPAQQSDVAAPVRAKPVRRPAGEEPHAAKPATGAQAHLPVPKRVARGERAAPRPTNEALNAVRKFGDNLPEIPANSYAADGTPRKIVIRPTSIQDVYYYSAPR